MNIEWSKISNSVIRAKCSYSDIPVEFDVSVIARLKGGFMLKFERVSGNESTARVVFGVIQLELNLEKSKDESLQK